MLFKDLKQGCSVYMFDRNNIEVHTVQVVTVSTPHMDKYNNQFDMVVDVAVLDAGKTQTYTFKDSNEVGYTGQLMITPNKECVIKELQLLKSQSQTILDNIDQHRNNVEKCNALIQEFDPAIKAKQENDARYEELKQSIESLKQMIIDSNKPNDGND